ncbi:MAG: hypothetical protein ACOX4W_03400 [Bacilli bacterium]
MNSEKIKKETAKLDKKEVELENQLQKELAEALKLKEEIEKEREKALKMAEREKQRQAERERKAIEREKEKERLRKEKEKEKEREKKRREREKIKAKEKAIRDKEKAKEQAKLQAQKEKEQAKLKAQREKEKEKERLRKEKEKASGKVAAVKPKAKKATVTKTTAKKKVPTAVSRAKSAKAREELIKKVVEEVASEEVVATTPVVEEVVAPKVKAKEPIVAEASDFTFISKEEAEKPAANPFPTSTNREFKPIEVKQEASFKDASEDDEESILEEARKKAGDGDLEDLRRRRLAAQEFLRAKQSEAIKTPKIEPVKIAGIDLDLALEADDSCGEVTAVDNSEFVEKIEELETVNKELSDKLELLELGSQDLEVKIKELDTINKDFEAKVVQLETANKEVLEKNISLETKYAKLEAKYEALEKLSLGVQSQIDALVKQLELLKNPSAIEPLERKTSQKDLIEAELSKKAKIITEYLEAEAEYKEKLTNIGSRKEQKLISNSEYEIMRDEILYEIKILQKERVEFEVKYEALLAELKFTDREAHAKWEAKGIVKKATPIETVKETSKPKEESKQMFTDKTIVVKDDILKLENDIKILSTEFTLTNEKITEIEEELKKQKSFENELKNSSEAMKEFQSYLFNLNKLILLLENQKVKTLKYKKDLENVSEPLGMKALKLRANIEDSLKEEKSLKDRKEYIENIIKDFDRFEDVRIYKRSLQDRAKMNELLKENKEKIRTIVEQRKSKEKYLSWYKDENKKYL